MTFIIKLSKYPSLFIKQYLKSRAVGNKCVTYNCVLREVKITLF